MLPCAEPQSTFASALKTRRRPTRIGSCARSRAGRPVKSSTSRSVDRLGRSLQDLVGFLSEIHALKIDLYLHQQGIDTTTPAGKAMFQMMGVFAEFERAMIQERVRAGLARAKADGIKLGRPKTDATTEKAIRAALSKGDAGMHKIAARFGVGTGTVQRIRAEMTA
jgi:DNA invertase Pin-like site-specific DNA recombinase